MIELIYERGPFGDETSNYSVKTDAIYLVDFIKQVLTDRSGEWGQIVLAKEGAHNHEICVCAYQKGKIIRRANDYDTYGIAKIKSIFANGGWSNMGYEVMVEDYDSLPKQGNEEFQDVYFGWNKQ